MQFHDLQSNIPEVKADKELYTVFKKVQKVLTEMMKEKCPSEEDLMELYGKIVVNCHQQLLHVPHSSSKWNLRKNLNKLCIVCYNTN